MSTTTKTTGTASVKVTPKHSTNKTKNSLVKVVVIDDVGKWLSPKKGDAFYIDVDSQFPVINFEIETDQPGPYIWSWSITWDAKASGLHESAKRGKHIKTFTTKGTFQSNDKKWKADLGGKTLGGLLTVEIKAGNAKFKRSVFVKGKNPLKTKISEHIKSLNGLDGFDALLDQESQSKNFINADGEPIVAFDGGYGMTQMTNPAPTYEQVWCWKENIKGGANLYKSKQSSAKAHLGQSGRSYTSDQLKNETWARWNGGSYYDWDSVSKQWVRKSNILCDTDTSNIGWNTDDEQNQNKTEDELHERDKASYKNPTKDKDPQVNKWKYTGVCYADHVAEK
jgi:hypothetical protein